MDALLEHDVARAVKILRDEPELFVPTRRFLAAIHAVPSHVRKALLATSPLVFREATGLAPLDHVLGGGLVLGSSVRLVAQQGSGASTLALQLLGGLGHRALYVTTEIRAEVAARMARLQIDSSKISVIRTRTPTTKIFERAGETQAATIVIDIDRPENLTEDLADLQEVLLLARDNGITVWSIGSFSRRTLSFHVETVVDVVLELSRRADGVLHIRKNRFGPTDRVGRFAFTRNGLVPADTVDVT